MRSLPVGASAFPPEERMSLSHVPGLNPSEMKLVTKVVTKWCHKHHISPYSDQGKAVMAVTTERVLAGERSSVILAEAIRSHMAIRRYQQPWE